MTVKDISKIEGLRLAAEGNMELPVSRIFCCDLLSIAMGKAPAGCAWVTVLGNKNTVAVASLTDTACIILAEGVHLSEADRECAAGEGISVFETELPVFEAALALHRLKENL